MDLQLEPLEQHMRSNSEYVIIMFTLKKIGAHMAPLDISMDMKATCSAITTYKEIYVSFE